MAQVKIDSFEADLWYGLTVQYRDEVEGRVPGFERDVILDKVDKFAAKLRKAAGIDAAASPGEMKGSGTLRKGGEEVSE